MSDRHQDKRRVDAWDAGLTDEQRDQVFREATMRGLSWDSVATWAAKEFKCRRPARQAFYDFIAWWRPQYVARRIQEKLLARDVIRDQREKLGDLSPELAQQLEDQALSLIGTDVRAAKTVFDMAARIREDMRKHVELQLAQQAEARSQDQLALDREKFRAAIASKVEQGLEALLAEIQGNPAAVELYGKLRSAVLQGVKAA